MIPLHFSKRSLIVLSAISIAILIFPALALAANPHFVSAGASINDSGQLTASFKEAGLGDNQIVSITLSADSTVVYACINGGGNHPKATNKETVNGPVSATGNFASGKNGTVNSKLTVDPLGPGTFSCPSGQSLVLASVSYSNVQLMDTTNGVNASIPGTFSKIFFSF